MKKRAPKKPGAVVANPPSQEWVEIETTKASTPLEVRIGSCVVSVSSGFDKPLFTEVCKELLSL